MNKGHMSATLRIVMVCLVLVTVMATALPPAAAYAEDPVVKSPTKEGNVQTVSSPGKNSSENVKKLNEALLKAAQQAYNGKYSGTKCAKVVVKKGIYTINGSLNIYSNTWLYLEKGAIIKFDANSGKNKRSMLVGSHRVKNGKIDPNGDKNCSGTSCKHTGYTQCVNVFVEGGTWDGGLNEETSNDGLTSPVMVSFVHAKDITIKDATFQNSDALHMINADGVDGLTVHKVKFSFHTYDQADKSVTNKIGSEEDVLWTHEAIHTDIIPPDGFQSINQSTAYPYEYLPCKNITINECTFSSCLSCIGTHTGLSSGYRKTHPGLPYTQNALINKCKFEYVKYNCVNAFQFESLRISDNTATDVNCFLLGIACKSGKKGNVVSKNTITNSNPFLKSYPEGVAVSEAAITLRQGSEFEVSENKITNVAKVAIYVGNNKGNDFGKCGVTVKNNTVEDPWSHGIYVRDGAGVLTSDNTVKTSSAMRKNPKTGKTEGRKIGIFLSTAAFACEVRNNTVDGFRAGIEASQSSSPKIRSNTVQNCPELGIALWDVTGTETSSAEVNGNTIRNCGNGSDCTTCGNGIRVGGITTAGTVYASIASNKVDGSGYRYRCIEIVKGSLITVSNNEVNMGAEPKASTRGIYAKANNLVISANKVKYCEECIAVYNCSLVILKDNEVGSCTRGIILQGVSGSAENLQITGGSIKYCDQEGLWISNSKTVKIDEISITNCKVGIKLENSTAKIGNDWENSKPKQPKIVVDSKSKKLSA